MKAEQLKELLVDALDDLKAREITVLNVRPLTDVTDYMIIASGTSNRHVKSVANNAIDKAKAQQVRPLGIEGDNTAEWVLVDFGDVVLHIMLPETRKFYDLERLWSTPVASHQEESGDRSIN